MLRNYSEDFIILSALYLPIAAFGIMALQYFYMRARIKSYKLKLNQVLAESLSYREAQIKAESQLLNSKKMSSLGEMAAGIVHEINTPLGINQLLLDKALVELRNHTPNKDRLIEVISKIETCSNRIAKIIRGLKSFSRDDQDDPLLYEDLGEIIEDSIGLYQQKLYYKGIKLSVTPINEEILIECRKTSLSQVIFNFLNNSFDAIENLTEKWIKLDIELTTESVKLLFTDSGSGIPSEVAKKMFQAFYTTKPAGKGTGLGLSICIEIIKAHHGSIQLDSLCTNTRFIIELPLRQPIDIKNPNDNNSDDFKKIA